ncbi:MAG: hypothetical protein NZ828_05115 [Alphaproteobacteria bacterium]|nr:hypothetical protein [Alphaproteobacteria bacterium]
MGKLSELFKLKKNKGQDAFPDGVVDKFSFFQDEIKRIGVAQKRDRTYGSVSLNHKRDPYKAGVKEWVLVQDGAVYIRYYDTDRNSCENLYAMKLDVVRQAFVLQRKYEFESAEEAITAFVNIMDEYGDAEFMSALKSSLIDNDLLLVDAPNLTAAKPENKIKALII